MEVMENELTALGWTLLFMAVAVGLLILGYAIFVCFCRTCRPFQEWAERGADEMEKYQLHYEDCGDGCVYVWELSEEEEA